MSSEKLLQKHKMFLELNFTFKMFETDTDIGFRIYFKLIPILLSYFTSINADILIPNTYIW